MAATSVLPSALRPDPWPAGDVLLGAAALVAGWCWLRRARERPQHGFLWLTGAAALTWGAAQTLAAAVPALAPGWAGAALVTSVLSWLGLLLGLVALLTVPLDVVPGGWVRLRAVAEAVLLAGATLVGVWLTLLGPLLERTSASLGTRLAAAAWCVAEAVLVFLVLLVARHGRAALASAGVRVVPLAGGLCCVAVGDLALHRVGAGVESAWLEALSVAGWGLTALAAGRPGRTPAEVPVRDPVPEGRGVPVAAAVVGCAAGLVATGLAAEPDPVLLGGVGLLVAVLGLAHVPVQRQGALTARRLASELDHRRTHDPLTDLLTRDALLARVAERDSGVAAALVLVRLRSVETVRASVGDAPADRLITVAAHRLREVPGGQALTRWGDGDLAALCPEGDAPDLARRFTDVLGRPVTVRGRERPLAPVCAILPLRLTEASGVRDDARAALDAAEVPGVTGPVGFSASLRADAAVRRRLGHDLEEAVAAGRVDVAFQPVVDVRTGRAVGAEALARWTHPDLGTVSPGVFVPLAEHRGCVDALGALVLDRALAEASRWQRAGRRLRASVNVSVLQLSGEPFCHLVARTLARHDVPPDALVLEVTETVLAEDTAAIRGTLAGLRELGVRVALDDFGTGFCSLAYLHTFPVDVLKLDRALVDGARDDPQRTVLLRAVAAMAEALGLEATAEGVCSPDEVALLVELGVPYAQGYHYARPMTGPRLRSWLADDPDPASPAPAGPSPAPPVQRTREATP